MNSIQVICLESRVLLWYSQIILVPSKSTGRPSEKNLAAEVDQSPSSTFLRGVITVGQRARETVHLLPGSFTNMYKRCKSRPSLAAYTIIDVHLCSNSNIDLYTLKPLRVVPNMEATQSWGMPSMPEHGAGTWWIVIGGQVPKFRSILGLGLVQFIRQHYSTNPQIPLELESTILPFGHDFHLPSSDLSNPSRIAEKYTLFSPVFHESSRKPSDPMRFLKRRNTLEEY